MADTETAIRRIAWSATAFSTLLYAIVAYATERNFRLQPLELALRRPVVIFLYVLAIAFYFAAFAVALPAPAEDRAVETITASDPLASSSATAAGRARFLIRLALLDLIAIMGLLAAFALHDWRIYLPAWALAIVGFLRSSPGLAPQPR